MVVLVFCAALYQGFFYADYVSERSEIKKHHATTRLTADEIALLQEGDFILRKGFGLFSDHIATQFNNGSTDVTHAGILVKEKGQWQVIHSLSSDVSDIDGLQLQPLDTFLHYSAPHKIIITRAKGANATLGKKIGLSAKTRLNKNIPFDHAGRFDDSTELFCTELIWEILEKDLHAVQLPSGYKARKELFYSMEPMYSTSYFDIIINQYQNKSTVVHPLKK